MARISASRTSTDILSEGTAMPAFERPDAPAFTDQDVADVLAYVRTLGEHKREKAVARNATPESGGKP